MDVPLTTDEIGASNLFLWGFFGFPVAVLLISLVLDATVLKHAAARSYQESWDDFGGWIKDRDSLAGKLVGTLGVLVALAFFLLNAWLLGALYGAIMAILFLILLVGIGELAALALGDFAVSETVAYAALAVSVAWAVTVSLLMIVTLFDD